MKKLLLLLLALPMVVSGQMLDPKDREDLSLIDKLYYARNAYILSEEERSSLHDIIFKMRADSTYKVFIIGYGDKWGGKEVNDRFSYVRAMYIAEWMRSCRVPREQIVYVGAGIDTLAPNDAEARRVEVLRIMSTVKPEPKPEPKPEQVKPTEEPAPTPEPQPAQTEEPAPVATQVEEPQPTQTEEPQPVAAPVEESQSVPVSQSEPSTSTQEKSSKEHHFTLRTNLLYWMGGLFNIGAEYRVSDSDFGFVLNAGYSPFSSSSWEYNLGGWFVSPEARYYIPTHEQWFVGAQFLAGGCNIKITETGRQGLVLGAGVLGGYKLQLTDNFDMDFTLALGYTHLYYDTYYYDEATDTQISRVLGVKKNTFLPIQGGVNLIWKIK